MVNLADNKALGAHEGGRKGADSGRWSRTPSGDKDGAPLGPGAVRETVKRNVKVLADLHEAVGPSRKRAANGREAADGSPRRTWPATPGSAPRSWPRRSAVAPSR